MYKFLTCIVLLLITVPFVSAQENRRDQLEGLVYEVEDWSEPKDALRLNQPGPGNWQIWTKEEDVMKKRSNGASVTTPTLPRDADRETPEDGAPVLHTKITGIPAGVYRVFMNHTNRPLALSFDGGKTWEPSTSGGELDFGIYTIQDGVFELWVDDRYASPQSAGWAYYDYIRFVPTDVPTAQIADLFQRYDENRDTYEICWTTSQPTPPAVLVLRPKDENQKEIIVRESDAGLRNHKIEIPAEELDSFSIQKLEICVPINRSGVTASVAEDWAPARRPKLEQKQTLRLPLSVAEPTSAGRENWPVTSGVPFAQGVLADVECLRLEDPAGKKIPAGFEPTAFWPDGSVRWLTVDFLADTSEKAAAVYTLVLEPKAAGQVPEVRTATSLDGDLPLKSEIVLADGRKLSMNGCRYWRNYCPETDRKGVFVQEGDYLQDGQEDKPCFRWRVESTEYNDTDIRRYRWTIQNNQLEEPFTLVRSASVRLTSYEEEDSGERKPREFSALQDTLDHVTLVRDGERQESDRFDGYLATDSQVVLLDKFWQTWPKGMAVRADDPETVEFQILPQLPEGYSADPKKNERDTLIQSYFWMQNDCYRFKRGMELSTDIWTASPERAKTDPNLAEHLKNPLFAACTPEYYCGTGVFPPVNPVRPGVFDVFENAFRNSYKRHEQGRSERGEYGWMSFGDWFGERSNNWGNNEYDLSYLCAMQFARSGDLALLRRGAEMARHYTTIDFRAVPWKKNDRERMYLHCFGHVGGFFEPDDPRLEGLVGQATTVPHWFRAESDSSGGHDHQPGNFYMGHLLGDPDIYEVGECVCTTQAKWYTPSFKFSIERAAGWPLTNAVYAYRFTNDPYYLNAARLYFEVIQQKQNPETGCFDLPQDQTECDCPDKKEHRGGKAFAVGVLLHGLARYYETEPDPARKEEIKTVIIRCADWLLDSAWNEAVQGFRYKTGCPKYQNSGWYSILVIEGLAYASEISGNPRYIDFLKRTLPGPIRNESGSGRSTGKDFTQKFRQTPHALYWLEKWGVTEF